MSSEIKILCNLAGIDYSENNLNESIKHSYKQELEDILTMEDLNFEYINDNSQKGLIEIRIFNNEENDSFKMDYHFYFKSYKEFLDRFLNLYLPCYRRFEKIETS